MFGDDLQKFTAKVEGLTAAAASRAADLVFESVVLGSPLTGAPGQPVDTGNLRASWQQRSAGPMAYEIITATPYAPNVEDGVGSKGQPVVYGAGGNGRSVVGGSHSVKLTVAGWSRILEHVAAQAPGGGNA